MSTVNEVIYYLERLLLRGFIILTVIVIILEIVVYFKGGYPRVVSYSIGRDIRDSLFYLAFAWLWFKDIKRGK